METRSCGMYNTRFAAAMAQGRRPDPFRTRKLRPGTAMVLHPEGCGRVARRRTQTSQGGDTTSVPPPFSTYPDKHGPPPTPGHGTNGLSRDKPMPHPIREPASTKPHTRQAHTPQTRHTQTTHQHNPFGRSMRQCPCAGYLQNRRVGAPINLRCPMNKPVEQTTADRNP